MKQSRKLTKMQIRRLSVLPDDVKQVYMLDLLGVTRGNNRFKYKQYFRNLKDQGTKSTLNDRRPSHMVNLFRGQTDMCESKNHIPLIDTAKNRWVGVEIECYIPDIARTGSGSDSTCYDCEGDGWLYATTNSGQEHRVDCGTCEGTGANEDSECDDCPDHEAVRDALSNIDAKNVSVRSDGSLCDSRGGTEVTFLFDANRGYDQLEGILDVLNDMGAEVDHTCGLHIHLNQHNTNADNAYILGKKVEKFLPVLSSFIPKSRRENVYCKLIASDSERYSAINLTAFKKHNTIEYRMHTGTTNFEKIKNWIDVLIKIEDFCKDTEEVETVTTLTELMRVVSLTFSQTRYFQDRYNKFNVVADSDNETAGLAA